MGFSKCGPRTKKGTAKIWWRSAEAFWKYSWAAQSVNINILSLRLRLVLGGGYSISGGYIYYGDIGSGKIPGCLDTGYHRHKLVVNIVGGKPKFGERRQPWEVGSRVPPDFGVRKVAGVGVEGVVGGSQTIIISYNVQGYYENTEHGLKCLLTFGESCA